MSIRLKLLLSYIAMVLVPLFMFALAAALLFAVFFNELKGLGDAYGINRGQPWYQLIRDSFDKRNDLLSGIKFTALNDPDRLTDKAFLAKIDEQFNQLKTGLVVVTDHRITYASPITDHYDVSDELQHLDTIHEGQKVGPFQVERIDFTLSGHRNGTVYILSDLTPFIHFVSKFLPSLFLSLLLAIGLTNGLLTYLVSRSIIKPLYALKQAAEHIQEGELDHEVNIVRKDEIGELGAAFEEMRRRLKESIGIQLRYEENRKDLISSISHDLRTPITGIKACVEVVSAGIADTPEKRDKYMKMIYKRATDLDRLIEELFLFSKLDLKRVPFHFVRINLSAYLLDFAEELRSDPQMQAVLIDFHDEGDRPVYVSADTEKLRRVLLNIIGNSLNYMRGESKAIRIELFDGEEEATVTIRDNGTGIEEEVLPHIFERFYRGEPSRNTATGGSGLGLAIVKQIVEGHGGKIRAESKLGEGTSIFFTLRKNNGKGGERS